MFLKSIDLKLFFEHVGSVQLKMFVSGAIANLYDVCI